MWLVLRRHWRMIVVAMVMLDAVFLSFLIDFRRVAIDAALRGSTSRSALFRQPDDSRVAWDESMQQLLQWHQWWHTSAIQCAVVGNSPRSQLALDDAIRIDSHQIVIRFNRPQPGAGARTTLRFVNVAFLDAPNLFGDTDEILVAHTTRANRSLEHVAAADFCRRLGNDRCVLLSDALVDGVASLLNLPPTSHPRTGVLGVAAAFVLRCQLPIDLFRFGRANNETAQSIDAHRRQVDAEEQLLTRLEAYNVVRRN